MFTVYSKLESVSWWMVQKSMKLYAWSSDRKLRALYIKYWNVIK